MRNKPIAQADSELLARLDRIAQTMANVEPEVLGQRVRRLRELQGLSIRQVAERAGISKNSIVRLEQGRGSQPITFLKICSVFGVHVERLSELSPNDVVAMPHKKGDDHWFNMADMGSRPLLDAKKPISAAQRKKAVDDGAVVPVNLLKSRLPAGKALPCVLELHQPSPVRSHIGEEFVYVLEGKVIVTVGGKKYRLSKDESLTFWSAEPHSYAPASSQKTPPRILSVRVEG